MLSLVSHQIDVNYTRNSPNERLTKPREETEASFKPGGGVIGTNILENCDIIYQS